MWLCFNDGFVSAVQDYNDPEGFVARARRRKALESLLPGQEVAVNAPGTSDYKYRVFCKKSIFCKIVLNKIMGIDYSNFKNSVKDSDLHDLYMDFWSLHHQYQE